MGSRQEERRLPARLAQTAQRESPLSQTRLVGACRLGTDYRSHRASSLRVRASVCLQGTSLPGHRESPAVPYLLARHQGTWHHREILEASPARLLPQPHASRAEECLEAPAYQRRWEESRPAQRLPPPPLGRQEGGAASVEALHQPEGRPG